MDDDPLNQIKPLILAWLIAYPGPLSVLDQPMLDADLPNASIQFYLDLGTDTLRVKVKYPSGTVKTAQVALV